MSKIIKNNQNCDKPLQPKWRESKMGYEFDFNADIWHLDGSKQIPIYLLKNVDMKTKEGVKMTLCRYAEEISANTTSAMFNYFNQYIDITKETRVTVKGLSCWKKVLTRDTEQYLGLLRSFIFNWHYWGYPGIDKEVIEFLEETELRGCTKGKAVKMACPYTGPLTLNEFGAVLDWSSNAYSRSELTIQEYSYLLVLSFTGRRPINIRSLRAKDLVVNEVVGGYEYRINFPRAKQKHTQFRSQFTPVPINKELYLVMYNQMNESIIDVENVIGEKLPNNLRNEVPIFVKKTRLSEVNSISDFKILMTEKADYLNATTSDTQLIIQKLARKCTAKSERTGDFMHLTNRRFRYTKATNLVRRGIRGVALAAALDQSNTEQIGVYTQNTEENAEQISKIMAPVLAPLAQAFAGILVASERDALRGNDPHSRIKNHNHNLGSCGTYSFCASGYRACYTCINFQPWLEAAHEEVLDEILQERERQEGVGVSSYVIQSTDRLLLAVQQVVDMCVKEKAIRG